MYFIIHELTFQFYSLIYIYSIINMVFSLIVVPGSPPPPAADESLPRYMEDGSMHSSIRDPHRILWYILLRPHHDRLSTYHVSRREMVPRDTHISCPSQRDDNHVTGCCYHPWSSYRRTCRHGDVCSMQQSYAMSCSVSPHPLMLLEDLLSPSGGYVNIYPPQDLILMRSIWSGVHVGSS